LARIIITLYDIYLGKIIIWKYLFGLFRGRGKGGRANISKFNPSLERIAQKRKLLIKWDHFINQITKRVKYSAFKFLKNINLII